MRTAIVPLSPAHSVLPLASELLWIRRHRAPMPSLVALLAGRRDVCCIIAATVALRHEVLGGALQLSGYATRDPMARCIGFDVFPHHQDAAINAPPLLTRKRR